MLRSLVEGRAVGCSGEVLDTVGIKGRIVGGSAGSDRLFAA